MKVLLVKVLLFDVKKGLFLLARRKMEAGVQASYSPPIGLLYFGRSLEDEGHSVEVVDFYCEKNPMETYRKRSAENVVEEFQELNDKYGSVTIVDDNFLPIQDEHTR